MPEPALKVTREPRFHLVPPLGNSSDPTSRRMESKSAAQRHEEPDGCSLCGLLGPDG